MNLLYFFAAYLLRPLRIISLVVLIAVGLMIAAFVFPWFGQGLRTNVIQCWTRGLLCTLGIRLQFSGTPPTGMVFIVANHVSWIDPFLLMACHPVRFVAKAEIRNWPILGWLAAQAGTIFIRRERLRDLVDVAKVVVTRLNEGAAVGVFPESTTTDGRRLLPFKAGLFQVAVSARADCYPVALHYDSAATIWIDDMGLLSSFWRIAAQPRITARIVYCPVIACRGQSRRDLAEASASAIATALCLQAPHIRPEIPADLPALTR